MADKRQYAERRSGELLPRHASAYIPPHQIPAQPDARTMENRTIRVAPELDPRLAMTQVSMQRVREQRRGYWGIVAAAALGSLLAVGVYMLLPRAFVAQNAEGLASGLPPQNQPAHDLPPRSETSLGAPRGASGNESSVLVAKPVDAMGEQRPGAITVLPIDPSEAETGIVEEITDPVALPRTTSRAATRVRVPHGKSSSAKKNSAAAHSGAAGSKATDSRGAKSSSAGLEEKTSNPDAVQTEDTADGTKIEGSKVWLE